MIARIKLRLTCVVLLVGGFPQGAGAVPSADDQIEAIQNAIGSGRITEAQRQVKQFLKDFPNDGRGYFLSGTCAERQGDQRFAESAYRTALKKNPKMAEAHNNLGTLLRQRGSMEEAAEHYRRATELKPDYAVAWYNRGTIALELSQADEAVKALDKAATYLPKDVDAQINLAAALERAGRNHDAENQLRKVVARFPKELQAHRELIAFLSRSRKFKEAGQLFEQAIKEVGKAPALLDEAARIALMQGRTDEALAFLKEALAKDRRNADRWCALGKVYRRLDQNKEAIVAYRKALKVDVRHARANLLLGLAYEAIKECAKAEGGISSFHPPFAPVVSGETRGYYFREPAVDLDLVSFLLDVLLLRRKPSACRL